MSKKNKNKRKSDPTAPALEPQANAASVSQPASQADRDMARDLKHVVSTILFVLALLVGLYYYDQQAHILRAFTQQLFSIL